MQCAVALQFVVAYAKLLPFLLLLLEQVVVAFSEGIFTFACHLYYTVRINASVSPFFACHV